MELLYKEFYSNLKNSKIQINWNKNPIKMEVFLKFLKVPVTRSTDHSGYITGWTLLYNDEYKLKIKGGKVYGTEYLDSIQYGVNLQNKYNNYINPFYMFDILTDEGKQFFFEYYKDEIEKIINDITDDINRLELKLKQQKELKSQILKEISNNL